MKGKASHWFGSATLLLAALPAPLLAQPAAPAFARIFGDHAVLQRGRPIAVWGTAAAGDQITVTLAGRSASAAADRSGHWHATLPAMPAGGPYRLTASSGAAATTLDDIAVGDVYLCGGQSNMEFPADHSTGAWGGFGDSADPQLRFVTIARDSEPLPLAELAHPAPWQVAGPDTVGKASAVCYYMARSLRKSEHAPIGFIASDWGGTTIQGWIGGDALRRAEPAGAALDRLALMARDPAAALAEQDRIEQAWWNAHDPQAAAERAFIAPNYDDSGWPSLVPAGSWKEAGVPALAGFDGVVWFRKAVTLTPAQAASANELLLGPIDTFDSAWVNGVPIGSNTVDWFWRDYKVPPHIFRPGRNVIVLRVLSGGKGGGLTGDPASRSIKTADGETIPLAGPWKYRIGMAAKGLSIDPAPWAVPSSLSTLYNGMIAPIAGYGFKLAAWYQGESNVGHAKDYRTLLPLLMADWRQRFGEPALPFLIVQLASYGDPASRPGESGWAELRDVQAKVAQADGHAGLAVSFDLGDRYNIHPTQKQVVGERLARAARAIAYGEPVTPGSPTAVAVTRSGADLLIAFRNAGSGLRTYSADQAIGFEACGAAGCRFVPGTVEGSSIRLKNANTPAATRVRYAWADAPYANLYSAEDLPAVPFELPVR